MTEAEWLTCRDAYLMLKFLSGKNRDRKLRLFMTACCRRAWPLLADERSRHALEVIDRHIEGAASDEELRTAETSAELAFQSAKVAVIAAHVGSELARQSSESPRGLFDFIGAATARRVHDAVGDDIHVLAASSVWTATTVITEEDDPDYGYLGSARCMTAIDIDPVLHHANLLRCLVGNPFRPISFAAEWGTSAVLGIAEHVYADRRFDLLPILADALQDAGCEDPAVLAHCREPGEHARGCWVVDGVLGKS